MRNVQVVREHQLQRVFSGRQCHLRLRLSFAEMHDVFSRRSRQLHVRRVGDVDKQVLIAAVRVSGAEWVSG